MSHQPQPNDSGNREYARIDVGLRVRIQPLDEERAERLRAETRDRASVWAPSSQSAIRDLASGSAPGPAATLAQAILEITAEVARMRARVTRGARAVHEATLVQLSGGGGRLVCGFPLAMDDMIEFQLDDDDLDVPPIRALGKVVHCGEDGTVGFSFESMHPRDQDLVMRLIYGLQRRNLRARQE